MNVDLQTRGLAPLQEGADETPSHRKAAGNSSHTNINQATTTVKSCCLNKVSKGFRANISHDLGFFFYLFFCYCTSANNDRSGTLKFADPVLRGLQK